MLGIRSGFLLGPGLGAIDISFREGTALQISAANGTCTRQFRLPTGVEIHRPCVSPGQAMHDFNDLPTVGWLDEQNLGGGFKYFLFGEGIQFD